MNESNIEVEVEGDNVEVEIENDAPLADQGVNKLKADPTDIPDDEISQYSDSVKKRIMQLTHSRHDERRAKEEAIREREAAIAYANKLPTKIIS